MTPAGEEAARFAADLIRIDTTNRGGGDARERPAAEYVAARLAEAGLEPVLLESAPGRANVVARITGTGTDRDDAQVPGSTIVPYCMSGGTDAKQFSRLGLTCYGFTPLVLPEGYDYYAMFHGTDERIPLSALEAGVRIMDRFLATVAA